jgi:hypothetical protein
MKLGMMFGLTGWNGLSLGLMESQRLHDHTGEVAHNPQSIPSGQM